MTQQEEMSVADYCKALGLGALQTRACVDIARYLSPADGKRTADDFAAAAGLTGLAI